MDNKEILKIITDSIVAKFGSVVDRVILFGSRVNSIHNDGSDYDILVILNATVDWQLEWRIYDACFDISLEYDIIIDVKILSSSDLVTIRGRQPFIQNALTNGITA